jgi:hypothetical protein
VVSCNTTSGIYRCAITIWRHLKESLRPQFSFEKADITYIHIFERLAGSSVTKLIGLHKREEDVLIQLKIRDASEKFKN